MIDLAKHIEVLLLDNDCVIIPGFGGFIAHNSPANWCRESSTFIPPIRTIGFNSQLKMNDGVLMQSYMSVYGTSFSDASKIVESETDELLEHLTEKGNIEFGNIGEISYSIDGQYTFKPFNHKLTSPLFYGLDSFEMFELEKEKVESTPKYTFAATDISLEKTEQRRFRINPILWQNIAAAIIIFVLFFSFSVPVENTYIEKKNYAQLLSMDLLENIGKHSLLTTLVEAKEIELSSSDEKINKETEEAEQSKPVVAKEVKVIKQKTTSSQPAIEKTISKRRFHLIVASVNKIEDGEKIVEKLLKEGYADAQVVTGEGKVRISVMSYTERDEANTQLNLLRQKEAFQNAWLLSAK